MKNYEVDNEAVIYRGTAIDCAEQDFNNQSEHEKAEIILANEHIVLMKTAKKRFQNVTNVEIIGLKDVKIFDDTVQIIQNDNAVKIYTLETEKFLLFPNANEATEFSDKAHALIKRMLKSVKAIK